MGDYVPRCGDHVHHAPSGEDWVVAYADAERDELAWTGWPEGYAKLSDCTTIERCSDEDHRRAVFAWIGLQTRDSRRSRVLRLYPMAGAVPA